MCEVLTFAIIHIHSITNVEVVFEAETVVPTYRSTWRRSQGKRITSTDMRRLTTGIRSEKCVVRRFLRCANVIECFDVLLTVHLNIILVINQLYAQILVL